MNKQAFLAALQAKLSGLPAQDVQDRLSFYAEMIDDRMEDGVSEEEAVAEIGSVDAIAADILSKIPLTRIIKEKSRPKRRLEAWEIVLLILGAPIWLSLLIALFAVVISLYAAAWSVIVSIWAVFGSLAASGVGCFLAGIGFVIGGHALSGVAMLGAGLLLAGLSVFAFFGCQAATGGILWLTKRAILGLKRCFIRKERVE